MNKNLSNELPWIRVARSLIGEKEIKGPRHNSKILAMWASIRSTWFKDDETPWCAGFVGHCLEEVGIVSTRSAAAASYRKFGKQLSGPAYGAIGVKGRTGGNHVAFCVGKDRNGNLLMLGGNQGDMVKISSYRPNAFDTWVWPSLSPHPFRYSLPVFDGAAAASSEA